MCLGFTPAKVKNASDQGIKCRIFDSMSNKWQSTQDSTGELNLLRRMEVTTENSATMASGHFYESICMARYQEPPSPDLQPRVYALILEGQNVNSLYKGIKCHAPTEHLNITFASPILSSRLIQAY